MPGHVRRATLVLVAHLVVLPVVYASPPRPTCAQVMNVLGDQLADAVCAESPDLTTNNPDTTPADNSLAGLPPSAFTPPGRPCRAGGHGVHAARQDAD